MPVLLLGAAVAGCKPNEPKAVGADAIQTKRPNVVLISVDSLRADHLSCYGYERKTSPNIDRLAAEGALFEVMVSSTSWTLPSHACMFTGLPDSVHGCDRNEHYLTPSRRTLAESFKDAGYRTAGFWSGPYLHPIFGLDQGFDDYTSCASYEAYSQFDVREGKRESEAMPSQDERIREAQQAHADVTNPKILEKVTAWLDANPKGPFFLFIHMWDVHFDYIPPTPYDTMYDPDYEGWMDGRNLWKSPRVKKGLEEPELRHMIALYDGEITWTDMHIGKILDKLDKLGLKDSTLVAFTGDHGEEFFEHDQFGHHKTLYDESVRVPLIMRYPGRIPAGQRLSSLARMVDIAPTLLDLAGVAPMPDLWGRSLHPAIRADARIPDEPAISELVKEKKEEVTTILGVRTSDWKLTMEAESGKWLGLWDLRADPGEQKNLAEEHGELRTTAEKSLQKTMNSLAEMRKRHRNDGSASRREMQPELNEQLKGLGYVGEDEEEAQEESGSVEEGDDEDEHGDGC